MIVGEESGARVTWAEELAPPSLHQLKSSGTQGGASAFVEMLIAESVAKAAFCSSLSTQHFSRGREHGFALANHTAHPTPVGLVNGFGDPNQPSRSRNQIRHWMREEMGCDSHQKGNTVSLCSSFPRTRPTLHRVHCLTLASRPEPPAVRWELLPL